FQSSSYSYCSGCSSSSRSRARSRRSSIRSSEAIPEHAAASQRGAAVPTRILGVSAYYHDSAACLVADGEIVAAAQEERFTRKKHDASFPSQAVAYCLREAAITTKDLDLVGFYEKPLVKFSRLLETYIACAPRGLRSYL